ncbi:hypothetical protein P3T76_007928 [Phytophthora citrophthora]|uniref:Uncharacterized protein n=1 Tax=Phytophthora citrophthora TaxID=4793 RepID=A0AAD9LM28_9STRA|nr:hypothetical protein P3T76_007928 [Phytophthora citrophthora]
METIVSLHPNAEAVWRDRFERLGGVPRLVLQDIKTDPKAFMRICISSLDACMRLALSNSKIKSNYLEILYMLGMPRHVHIHSEEPYLEYILIYASKMAMKAVVQAKWIKDRDAMLNFLVENLNSTDRDSLTQAICECIFELYAMQLLELGGTFRYRNLQTEQNCENVVEDENDLFIPMSWRKFVDRVEVGQSIDQLYVPKLAKDVAIDAWMVGVGGFQLKKYDIKSQAVDELALLGRDGNRLFFLVPPQDYDSFKKQKPLSIEQFALLIPIPER